MSLNENAVFIASDAVANQHWRSGLSNVDAKPGIFKVVIPHLWSRNAVDCYPIGSILDKVVACDRASTVASHGNAIMGTASKCIVSYRN